MSFAHPAWLAALALIPALIVAAVLAARTRNRAWRALVAPRLTRSLLRLANPLPRWIALATLLAALACLIVTLARPQGDGGTRTESLKARNILIAIDLSHSMLVEDVSPNRLDQARAIALELLDALPDDRVGVIAFAGAPYLVAPLTIDHGAVRETIQQLDTDTIPTGGSNLAGAARMAIKAFADNHIPNGALVILSDGEEHGGDIASTALDADRAGLFVFAVAIGTDGGGLIPDPRAPDTRFRDNHGNPVHSRRHDEALRRLASETGGRFLHATSGSAIGPMVDAATGDLERLEIDTRKSRVSIEFYQWLLLPAVLLLMAAIIANTRWRPMAPRTAIAAASLALLPLSFSHSPPSSDTPQTKHQETANNQSEAHFENHQSSTERSEIACPTGQPEGRARRRPAIINHQSIPLLIPISAPSPDHYARLATEAKSPESRSRYRLAEGDAALAADDLRDAEAAFSSALLSPDPAVQSAAHHNLGNVLIEKGWRKLSGDQPYPGGAEAPKQLEDHVAKQLAKWLTENPDQADVSESMRLFESVLLSWTDAARHFDSAVDADPSREDSSHNREVAGLLLDELRKTIRQTLDAVKQQLPNPQPQDSQGQGQPQPQEGDKDQQQKSPGETGEQNPDKKSGEQNKQGGNQESDNNQDNGDKNDDPSKPDKGNKKDEGETPKEHARRLLRENADFESGPMIRGRRYQPRRPDFDW